MFASISVSLTILFIKIVGSKKKIDIKKSIFHQLIVALLIISIWNVFSFHDLFFDPSWELFVCAFYCGFFATAIGFIMMIYLAQNISSYKAGYVLIGVPVFGYMLSSLIFNIKSNTTTEIAILLIVVGLLCSAKK